MKIKTQDKSKIVELSNTQENGNLGFVRVFLQTSWKNRSLLAICQAKLVNNLIFGISWGLFTLYFLSYGMNTNDIGFLKALHPGIWGCFATCNWVSIL